jgi:hypothetical protein
MISVQPLIGETTKDPPFQCQPASPEKPERSIIMRDAYDARMWGEHHQSFTSAINNIIAATMAAMTKLNEIQFEAPWRAQPRGGKIIGPAR